ncbi:MULTISPECIES: hypothetical protein [Clostridium]|uniref:Uncharacterized protein n=2 Tax=Clostridium butyricum TaxID=1492 RepID=C4IL08_CLOBU|nr:MULTISPECIES: hypothetical protein [Clostridium]EEP52922.1 hypothetical protein CLP_1437 [Clostridium butyricum E4 str. BoNT E BL5262]EMU55148.1 hypothetical protein CBDKU1_09570 [Clostridium butyricum DKU-01]KJZ84284.1 hypothetical protein ClosIBUN125C_CONTIG65g03495 [Clostridium sp. IBUN125C]KJZ90875.1 hypothetical protein ClosIBUN62F_CONTIG77g02845 [Clostridium sp. IBUN62F]KJZ93547.1 hypothetical protein ClosIBUN22A_CONTIG155g03248 [Clostridium sp. IBUN22A]
MKENKILEEFIGRLSINLVCLFNTKSIEKFIRGCDIVESDDF